VAVLCTFQSPKAIQESTEIKHNTEVEIEIEIENPTQEIKTAIFKLFE